MKARSRKRQNYVTAARAEYVTNEIAIDDDPRISPSDAGCWVAAWVYVSDQDAKNHTG